MRKPVVTFVTDEKTDKALRIAAAELRITRAELVRRIVANFLVTQPKTDGK